MEVSNPESDKDDKQNAPKDKVTLKVYKNGFIMDNGPFRNINDPENKKFMDEVEKGFIPQELVNQGYKELGIALEDFK
jgi:UBX domain-containing protein 1